MNKFIVLIMLLTPFNTYAEDDFYMDELDYYVADDASLYAESNGVEAGKCDYLVSNNCKQVDMHYCSALSNKLNLLYESKEKDIDSRYTVSYKKSYDHQKQMSHMTDKKKKIFIKEMKGQLPAMKKLMEKDRLSKGEGTVEEMDHFFKEMKSDLDKGKIPLVYTNYVCSAHDNVLTTTIIKRNEKSREQKEKSKLGG